MILGESGTGKELVAAALHAAAPEGFPLRTDQLRRHPENLIESELFGHVRGAFHRRRSDEKGALRAAHRGTLFLDEVGELPQPMQSKLLRVLQERSFRRVGGNDDISIDIRIVCASKRDLHREMVEGRFRDDLYFRLNVIQVIVPPLRDRREDIPALAAHFLAKFSEKHGKPMARIDGEAMRALLAYDFPETCGSWKTYWSGRRSWRQKMSSRSLPSSERDKIRHPGGAGPIQNQESFPEEGVFLDTEMDRLEKIHLLNALEKNGRKSDGGCEIIEYFLSVAPIPVAEARDRVKLSS